MMPTDVGVVDLMIGFPSADARRHHDFLRTQFRDDESRRMEFPVEYIFKRVPNYVEEGEDPVEVTLAAMDKHGIAMGLVGIGADVTNRALAEHPDRFVASLEVDPNDITKTVRRIRQAHDEYGIKAVTTFPAGCNPQVPVSDRRYYAVYQACIDLDLPIIANAGIAGPALAVGLPARHALRPGLLRLPRAAHRHAPRRRAVGGAGGQAHAEVAGALLHDLRVRTQVLPEGDHRLRQHSRRRQGHVRRLLPDGPVSRAHLHELPDVPFRDHVWPKFLRENALRVFNL